ncbi:MAG: hypothetical protein CG439_1519 [Methylococcaceae bacterium NSP1-2]|nr:MAG: hypothetical protein CG439_1519 [Methylococcaceae bacterium NSP1-2]
MNTEQETPMNTTDKVSDFAHETVDTITNATHQSSQRKV